MISIANIYKFSLPNENISKNSDTVNILIRDICEYLDSESISYQTIEKKMWVNYSLKCLKFEKELWGINFFYIPTKKSNYYYPDMYIEIFLSSDFEKTNESLKKAIFFVSNIFECFDIVDEKNLLVEFHSGIYKVLKNENSFFSRDTYNLHHDFINIWEIDSLEEKYNAKIFEDFIKWKWAWEITPWKLKQYYPENYRVLLVFLYNIFSLEKSISKTESELGKMQELDSQILEASAIELAKKRLELNRENTIKILQIYRVTFENFFKIMVWKQI